MYSCQYFLYVYYVNIKYFSIGKWAYLSFHLIYYRYINAKIGLCWVGTRDSTKYLFHRKQLNSYVLFTYFVFHIYVLLTLYGFLVSKAAFLLFFVNLIFCYVKYCKLKYLFAQNLYFIWRRIRLTFFPKNLPVFYKVKGQFWVTGLRSFSVALVLK